MAKDIQIPTPTKTDLKALSVKHEVDERTIMKALRGESIKGDAVSKRANAAALEWIDAHRTDRPKPPAKARRRPR